MRDLLMRSQKNEVFDVIKEEGFYPSFFEWSVVKSSFSNDCEVSRLNYIDSEYFYTFDMYVNQFYPGYEGKHYAIYSPGFESKVEEQHPESWDRHTIYIKRWLSYLRREIGQPDLWSEISKYKLDFEISEEVQNSKFSPNEIEKIKDGINQVRDYLEERELVDKEQNELINEKLDYLIEASKKQGRRDWILMLLGVLFTFFTGLPLKQEEIKGIMNIIKATVSDGIKYLTM